MTAPLPDKRLQRAFEVVPRTVRLATRRASQTRLHVIRQDDTGRRVEGSTYGGNLAEDFWTVSVGVDHASDRLEMPRSARQTFRDLGPPRVGTFIVPAEVMRMMRSISRIGHRGAV